jgi:hypothetical protein
MRGTEHVITLLFGNRARNTHAQPGGGGEIRTPDTLRHTGFQDRRTRPTMRPLLGATLGVAQTTHTVGVDDVSGDGVEATGGFAGGGGVGDFGVSKSETL